MKKPDWYKSLLKKRMFILLLLILEIFSFIYFLKSSSMVSDIIKNTMTLISIIVCLYIVSKRDKGAYKLSWVFLILLFPLFGGMFYLFFNLLASKAILAILD